MSTRSVRRPRVSQIVFALAAVVVAVGCEPLPTDGTQEPALVGNCTASGSRICTQLTVGGTTRKFFTHRSPQLSPATGRPVVLFFHGDGGSGAANLASLYARTDLDGAIVVQMDGLSNTWSFYMDGTHVDDVAFTKAVVDGIKAGTLLTGLHIDPHRIYAIGNSRGGFMVNTLTVDSRSAGLFSAVAPIAGNFYCESGDAVCTARVNGTGMAISSALVSVNGDADGAVPPPAVVPTPPTATITGWPWPHASMAYAHGCATNFRYVVELVPSMSGKPTYLYRPDGACSHELMMVLVKGGGHGVSGWETPVWSWLSSHAN